MRLRFGVVLALLVLAAPIAGAAPAVPEDEAAIVHALNRLAFGAAPSDMDQVQKAGLARWIEAQLHPERIDDAALRTRLARLETIGLDAATVARDFFLPARAERRARQQAASGADTPDTPGPRPGMNAAVREERRIFAELAEAKLLRAVYSPRQLEEVLVDFWFNHFNVFARKGQTGIYLGEYERDVIRPRVLGKFRDLLGATASSPAMLVYLDNWQSAAKDTRIRNAGPRRGLNENYARELLELHTLGVDGGYTQDDVVNVARAFTGWTLSRPEDAGFRFAPLLHDRGVKTVLGHTIAAGGGKADGDRVLDILSRHPSTARHVAFKLAQRFVSDTPPQALVDRAARTFVTTDGDLRQVVRTIVTSPEFFDASARQAKVKTPFEFVASALRAADAEVHDGQPIVRALADMGMPLYLCQPPTGYGETAEAWFSSGALVTRINFAVSLSRGEMRGVRLAAYAGAPGDPLRFGSAEFQRQ